MKLFEYISKFFGVISVKEKDDYVRVTGIDGLVMNRYIIQIWQTNVLNRMMFTTVTDTSFTIASFFIPDLVYMLKEMMLQHDVKWSAKETIKKIISGIYENTWFKSTVGDITPMVDNSRLDQLKWTPMPKQLEFLHIYGDKMPRYNLKGYILALAPGGGKALSVNDRIRTPNGWTRMGDIKIDQKVIAPDGSITKVTGIYPQGVKSLYRITFEDGRSVKCDEDHFWKVYTNEWRICNLKDIQASLKKSTYKLYIPLIEPEIKDDVELSIDPYFLGKYLYKGCLSKSYKDRNTKIRLLENLGLSDDNIFIPDVYMNSSYKQKLSLLQGIMDLSGTVKGNSVVFTTDNKMLALQIQEMIRSLGGICKKKNLISGDTQLDLFTNKSYKLKIKINDLSSLFRLTKNKERCPKNNKSILNLRIKSVEPAGDEDCQCIAVDHPDHLYITNEYIVTHNTFTDLMVATCVIPPNIAEVKIIISPKKALNLVWEDSIKKVFKTVPTYWVSDSNKPMPYENCEYYVFNYEQIDKAIELANSILQSGRKYFVIVDESHNFADPKSGRTKKLIELQTLRGDVYFIWTSGSPILKSGSELVSYLRCADPRFNSDTQQRFAKIYSASPGRAGEIFRNRLGQMMAFIVGKKEFSTNEPIIVKELPIKLPANLANRFLMKTVKEDMKIFIKGRLEFYAPKMKEYRTYIEKIFNEYENSLASYQQKREFKSYKDDVKVISKYPDMMLADVMARAKDYERKKLLPYLNPSDRKEFRSTISAVKNIKLKVRGEALGSVLSKRRSECAVALGLNCHPETIINESLSKTIFFASSVAPVKELNDYLLDKGFLSLLVWSGTNSNLTNMIESFTNNSAVNPICATMQSLSEAVPVTAASTVVLLNRPYREALFQQSVSRADRLGQKFQVTVIETTLDTGDEPNVSSTTDDILASVRAIINELIGPEFGGPDPNEREYLKSIDASAETDEARKQEEDVGLL